MGVLTRLRTATLLITSIISTFSFAQIDEEFFLSLKNERITSNDSLVWKQFGPGMSGYNEEFWCHPTDTSVMFMGPDMHVAYGTWDNGRSWQAIKDYDGDGLDLERVNDLQFSASDPDFGIAIERRGKVFQTTDRGRTWELVYLIPHAAESPWYNAHSRAAIHPADKSIWYVGAGGFWDVKGAHRAAAYPQGKKRPIHAYGYILKTTDSGKTWNKIATDISPDLDIGRILINPNNPDQIVFASGQGMFMSIDAGDTWSTSNTGLPNNLPKDISAYHDPETGEYILYTVEQSVYTIHNNTVETVGGVYKSADGGATWESITGNLGLDFTEITDYSHRDRYASTVAYWTGKSKNEIKALDYPSHTLQVFRRLVVNPQNKNEIYLMANQRHDKSFGPGDIWKTEDGGATWKIVTRHGTYWIGGNNKSYWETKGMTTEPNVEFAHLQVSLDNSHESASANRHLAINAVGEVFIGINQQTHRSNDGGDSWQQIDDYETANGSDAWIGRGNSNLPGRFILSETGVKGRMLLCSGEHGLWETAELGNWHNKDDVPVRQIQGQVNDHSGNHDAHSISTVAVHPDNPDIIFILSWRQEHRGWLRKSIDGGKTWFNVVQLFDTDNGSWEATASQFSLKIDPVNPDNMYFTAIYMPISCGTNSGPGKDLTKGEYGVYYSYDGGESWNVSNKDFPEGSSVNRIILDPDNPEVLYAALNQWRNSDPYGLYMSADKAKTWTEVTIPSEIRSVNNVFIDRNTKYMYISCGARTGAYDAGGVWRSKDKGDTWELFFKAPYVWYTETSPVNPDLVLVYAAGQVGGAFKNPGMYLSRNDGNSWTKMNKGLINHDKMVDIELDPYDENIVYAAGWGSGWYKARIGGFASNSVAFEIAPSQLEVTNEVPLTVNYSATEEMQVVTIITAPDGTWLGNNVQIVPAGSGSLDMTISLDDDLAVADGYIISCDIRPVGAAAGEAVAKQTELLNIVEKEHITFIDLPEQFIQSQSITVTIDYHSNEERWIAVVLNTPAGNYITNTKATVQAGSGTQEITLNLPEIPTVAQDYIIKCDLRPVGGGYNDGVVRQEQLIDIIPPVAVQSIELKKGWNLVSLHILPFESLTGTVFPNAEIVKTFDAFYDADQPEYFNSLQNIHAGAGYLVFNAIDELVDIEGSPEGVSNAIILKTGWNLIGCPVNETQSIETALSSIADQLQIVKDFEGFYEQENPPEMNSIINLSAGKAYFIKVSADCELQW